MRFPASARFLVHRLSDGARPGCHERNPNGGAPAPRCARRLQLEFRRDRLALDPGQKLDVARVVIEKGAGSAAVSSLPGLKLRPVSQ